jgi:CRP/FNR family cyclic AMP-dependent transcriptional regulator
VPEPAAFLQLLPQTERDELLAIGRRKRWQRGDRLMRTGDPASGAIVLLTGLVKVHKNGAQGAEVVLALSGPGDLLGEISVTPNAVRSADVTALESVDGVVIPVSSLRTFLARRPSVTVGLLELALARLRVSDLLRLEFATAGSLPRVTSRLVELAERFGTRNEVGGIDVGLPINQEELASWSASSRESTARALRTLRELGLIETHRRRLVVLDLDRLRAHSTRL